MSFMPSLAPGKGLGPQGRPEFCGEPGESDGAASSLENDGVCAGLGKGSKPSGLVGPLPDVRAGGSGEGLGLFGGIDGEGRDLLSDAVMGVPASGNLALISKASILA